MARLLMLLLRGFAPELPGRAAGASGTFSPPPAETAALASAIFSFCGCDPRQAAPHPSAASGRTFGSAAAAAAISQQVAAVWTFYFLVSFTEGKRRRELASGWFPAERFLQDNAGHRLFAVRRWRELRSSTFFGVGFALSIKLKGHWLIRQPRLLLFSSPVSRRATHPLVSPTLLLVILDVFPAAVCGFHASDLALARASSRR